MTSPDKPPVRLLVVDDDLTILKIYDDVLRSAGFEVLLAASCAQAMSQLARVNGDVSVMLVDFGLPDCDGPDLVRDAVAKYGPKPTMYISGWTDEFWQLDQAPGRWIIMRKPLAMKKMLAAVDWLAYGGDRPKELDEE